MQVFRLRLRLQKLFHPDVWWLWYVFLQSFTAFCSSLAFARRIRVLSWRWLFLILISALASFDRRLAFRWGGPIGTLRGTWRSRYRRRTNYASSFHQLANCWALRHTFWQCSFWQILSSLLWTSISCCLQTSFYSCECAPSRLRGRSVRRHRTWPPWASSGCLGSYMVVSLKDIPLLSYFTFPFWPSWANLLRPWLVVLLILILQCFLSPL